MRIMVVFGERRLTPRGWVSVKSEPVDRIQNRILESGGVTNHPKAEACVRAMYAREQAVILGGGSGGGGKSHTLRVASAHFAFWLFKNKFEKERLFFATQDYPALRDRHLPEFTKQYGEFGQIRETKDYGLAWIWDDARIPVICFRNLEDPNKRKGSEFAGGFIDETTELMRAVFGAVLYMCRRPGIPHNPVLTMSNPDGPGFRWCRDAWRPQLGGDCPAGLTAEEVLAWALIRAESLPAFDSRFDESGQMRPADYIYIPFKPQDNPTFDANRWWRGVSHLARYIQLARWNGQWKAPEGARWPWLEEERTLFSSEKKWPQGLPLEWKRLLGVDWGDRAPFAAIWIAVDFEGNLWVYREVYQNRCTETMQIALIKERTGEGERIDRFVGDRQMFQKHRLTGQDQPGPSINEIYDKAIKGDARFKCGFEEGPTGEIIQKMAHITKYLEYENGYPDIYIEDSCSALWGELTGMVYESGTPLKERSEKLDPNCPKHAIDGLVYPIYDYLVPPKKELTVQEQIERAVAQGESQAAEKRKAAAFQDAMRRMRR